MAVRSTGRSGGRRLALALLVLLQACLSAGASEASQNATDSNSSATIATYSVEDEGSTCIFMSSIGTGILLGITDSPEDASVLEEATQYPNAGAVKELVTYHQRGVNVFFTVIWGGIIFFAIFMVAAIIQFLYIMCTGEFKHHVRESNMGVYIFCVIAVIALFLVLIVLLVCLMGCRGALVDSTDDKVPAVYSSTFDNLRKFVQATAVESSRVDDRSVRVKRVLEGGFHRAFGDFLARAARTDGKVPLFRLASECDENGRLDPADVSGDAVRLPGATSALTQQCTRFLRSQREVFDKLARTVEASTVEYRRELSDLLSDVSFVTDASDGSAVLTSVESIDRLQKSVDEYESNKGTFATLAKDAHNDFFWINVLLLVCLIALVITLLMGVAIHDKTAKPPYRSKLSHIIGFLFVITAFLFAIFAIIAIFDTMYLTTVNVLGHIYLCEPYMNEKYYVLDDALERLWPSNNRSLLLSKITPSKVMGNCINDSIASLVLSRKLTHRKYVERNTYHDPAQHLRMLYELHNNPLSSHRDSFISRAGDSSPFDEVLCLPNASTSLLEQPTKTCRSNVRKSVGKLTALGITNVQLYKDVVEKTLFRMAPFYFSRFVERLVDAVHSSASTSGGRCSTLRSILSSFMDVVCYTYVLELVSYWVSLMLATFAAILVIPFCFMLSKYFFRTERKKFKKRRAKEVAESSSLAKRRVREFTESSSLAERRVREFEASSSLAELSPQADTSSGYSVSLSYTTQEEPTTEVTRRVVYQSRSSRIYDPFAHIYAPAIRRQTSFTSLLSGIPLQHIRRIHSVASYAPQPIAFSRSVICHHHNPPLPVVAAPIHSPSCIFSLPPAPVVSHSPRSARVVHQIHSHTAVAPHVHRHSRTAVVSTNRHMAPSPSVVRVSSPPPILTKPPTVLAAPSKVLTKSTTVVTQQPTVVATPPTVLTPPPTVLAPPPPTVPLIVQPTPPTPPVTTSPVGSGPAENQQAATAHMTINFYGNPAGGAFTMPMTGYPLGYPTTGYVAAAGQPYYYAAPTAAPVATPTVAAAQPVSLAAPACQAAAAYQYAYSVPQQQSVATRSVSTRSVCSRPSSPAVMRVPAATTVTAQPARTQLYTVPPS